MCGLTGFWDFNFQLPKQEIFPTIQSMSSQIEHRGPDSQGCWYDESAGIALGHQRLSIVDLSPLGYQPMVSNSGRFILVYNGEIFNASELRRELGQKGLFFKGGSDTEVLLEACAYWGVEATCKRLIGMFAFTLWDRQERLLTLVRDRLGVKPLYWGFHRGILFFGSQLKSFSKHPIWNPEIDRRVLVDYFRTNYIPAPHSIYKGIYKLAQGHILTIDAQKREQKQVFWDLKKIPAQEIEDPITQLEILLKDAVKRRIIADVPLGAFLSGGIDSSIIVSLMQAQSSRAIKTFSIGSDNLEYDESDKAEKIAQYLGTEHQSWKINDKQAIEVIPRIPEFFDEPFGDSSQIPTYLVSKLAKQQVAVALSGDGGDELFAGYNRHRMAYQYWPYFKKIPIGIRCLGEEWIRKIPICYLDKFTTLLPKRHQETRLGEKIKKASYWLSSKNSSEFYYRSISPWNEKINFVVGVPDIEKDYKFDSKDLIREMQQEDLLTYLPDDILTKVDRASMAVALEGRVPFLDHRVVEFAMNLPINMKLRGRETKWILRRILEKYVPKELTHQEKKGFGIPLGDWLRGPLRDWAEILLSEKKLEDAGLKSNLIRKKWEEHLNHRQNYQEALWGVLMFQAWLEKWSN